MRVARLVESRCGGTSPSVAVERPCTRKSLNRSSHFQKYWRDEEVNSHRSTKSRGRQKGKGRRTEIDLSKGVPVGSLSMGELKTGGCRSPVAKGEEGAAATSLDGGPGSVQRSPAN